MSDNEENFIDVASVPEEKDNYSIVVKKLVESFKPLIKRWKTNQVGSWDSWIHLLKQVMRLVEPYWIILPNSIKLRLATQQLEYDSL